MPKETRIIMSGNHPVKILNGTKTQTRRTWGLKEINEHPDRWQLFPSDVSGEFRFFSPSDDRMIRIKCPYGGIGDRLWVKETWRVHSWDDEGGQFDVEYQNGGIQHSLCVTEEILKKYWLPNAMPEDTWRPSLFMPRWASRILLEITELRAETVDQISYDDAKAEGCISISDFAILWNSLNAKRGYPWNNGNWWIWVIGFGMIKQ